MKIAIVGTGISGLVAAHLLRREHDLTVFEAGDHVGGHTNTLDVETPDGAVAVDTGFIVFNERTYPNYCALLRELGVPWQTSDMSFSVRCERTGLEYNGTSLNTMLAQRLNALRPSFWSMVRDILRFYREAPAVLDTDDESLTLGDYLDRNRYGRPFVEQHLIPMGAAVWSSTPDAMRAFPLRTLVRFFHNHGFLQVDGRPQWLVVKGGSREYVKKLTAPFADRIRLRTPVTRVARVLDGVTLTTAAGEQEHFDRAILACHSDQALRLLETPSAAEREVLGAIPYQRNEAVLHTDERIMPKKRLAWASWNYHVSDPPAPLPTVTYWMNELQSLQGTANWFVTLNRSREIAPDKILRKIVYHHPIYDSRAPGAQARHAEIDGVGGVHFCGAYWGYGFHEDGVRSALAVARNLDVDVPIAEVVR